MSQHPPSAHNTRRPFLLFVSLTALLLLIAAVSISVGSTSLPWSTFPKLLSQLWSGHTGNDTTAHLILLKLRLPRILLGILAGYSLALCGCVMQGVFRNPLAEPYLLGIAGGAACGAALFIAFGWASSPWLISLGAFGGGMLAIIMVYALASLPFGGMSNTTLILIGVAIGAMFGALTSLFSFFSEREQLQQIIFWMMGDLGTVHWGQMLPLSILIALGSMVLIFLSPELNALSLGDNMATHLGVRPHQLKLWLLSFAALLTSAVVAVAGTIGFVGLIIPHMMRSWVGAEHRILLPASGLAGAIFLLSCDTIARTALRPLELPVGLVTSLFGAPFFLFLLYRQYSLHTPTSS